MKRIFRSASLIATITMCGFSLQGCGETVEVGLEVGAAATEGAVGTAEVAAEATVAEVPVVATPGVAPDAAEHLGYFAPEQWLEASTREELIGFGRNALTVMTQNERLMGINAELVAEGSAQARRAIYTAAGVGTVAVLGGTLLGYEISEHSRLEKAAKCKVLGEKLMNLRNSDKLPEDKFNDEERLLAKLRDAGCY